jgi:hypothetical protein
MKIELRRKRDLGKILDDSFALYRANFGTLILLSLVVVVPVDLLVFGVGFGDLWSDYRVRGGNQVKLSDLAETLTALGVQLLVVTPLITAMTVHVVRRAAEGARPGTGEAVATGLRLFPQLVSAILLVAIGVLAGLMLLIVPGVILAVRLIVVAQVVVVEGEAGGAALRRGFALTQGHAWFAFFVLFVLNLLVGVFSTIVLLPLDAAAKSADTMAFGMLAQMISSALSLPLVAIAYTLLYYSLVAEKEGAAPVRPPDPDVSAWRAPGSEPDPPPAPQSLPGVPGTFGDGWAPPRPPG